MVRGFWSDKKVLVGGGCGFLGSYVTPLLVEFGARVTVVDNLENGYLDNLESVKGSVEFIEADLRDPSVCHDVTKNVDLVINMAAKAQGMEYSRRHHGEMLVSNLLTSMILLDAAQKNDVERYVIFSSSCVYPDDAPVPTPELPVFTDNPESVNEGYGWAKRVQELAGTYYAQDYDMNVSIIRPFNPYGGNYRWRSEAEAHVVPALVKRVMDGENPLAVWGSGKQRRNLLHASDAAWVIAKVIEKDLGPVPVNIGYEDDTAIADLVELICDVSGKSPEIVFDTTKPEGRFRKCADSTLLRKVTENYSPKVTLSEGIAEMIEWYRRSFG